MHMMHDVRLAAVDLNLLVAARALLSERHVTRASRQLGLSQSATSHALARLRELYGDPLLVRSGRGLSLTARAQRLLPQLSRGLEELEASLRAEARFDPATARQVFRVYSADYGHAVLFGRLLALLRAEAPGVDLQVVGEPDALGQLEAGDLDFALLPKQPPRRQFKQLKLFSDGFVCMLRRGHPALVRKRLSLEQYLKLGHLLVAPGHTPGSYVDGELQRRGLSRRIVLQVSSFLVAPLVVAETDLISTGPRRLLERMAERYPIELLATPLPIPGFDLNLMWHSRRDQDAAQQWMRGLVVRACQTL